MDDAPGSPPINLTGVPSKSRTAMEFVPGPPETNTWPRASSTAMPPNPVSGRVVLESAQTSRGEGAAERNAVATSKAARARGQRLTQGMMRPEGGRGPP